MSNSFASNIWDRRGKTDTMSNNLYAFLVCFWTALGVAFTGIIAWYTMLAEVEMSWGLAIGVMVVAIGGIFLSTLSDNPVFSLVGYGLVAGPFGVLLGPVIALYTTVAIWKALFITSAVVMVLGTIGATYPKSLSSWQGPLLGALLILLCGYFIVPIGGLFGLDVGTGLMMWDWVGLIIFGALVIFDLNRAMRIPKTFNNSIDCALALYLDFVNIFIRILALTGNSSSKD